MFPFHQPWPQLPPVGASLPRQATYPHGAYGRQLASSPFGTTREVLLNINRNNLLGASHHQNHSHNSGSCNYHRSCLNSSPFNSSNRNHDCGRQNHSHSHSHSHSGTEPPQGERYVYPSDHFRVNVFHETRNSSFGSSNLSRRQERDFTAVIPIWATSSDIYDNLGRSGGKRYDIHVRMFNGDSIPLDNLRDMTELGSYNVEALILVES